MGKESCLLLPLLLFLLFSKTAQQDNVKQSTQIIVLLQNILEGEQSNGECFSYSNSFYLCTGSDDWEKGLAYFDDFVPSQGSITGITITANGDTSCSALTTSRKFTFYLNDENVGVWKASPVPFNCTLDHCDEPDQAPFVKMSQKNPFLRGQQNKIEMEDDEVIDNAGTGCYGSYNVSISYTGPASPSPSPFPVPPSPSPFPSPTPSPPPSPSPFPSPSPSPSPPEKFYTDPVVVGATAAGVLVLVIASILVCVFAEKFAVLGTFCAACCGCCACCTKKERPRTLDYLRDEDEMMVEGLPLIQHEEKREVVRTSSVLTAVPLPVYWELEQEEESVTFQLIDVTDDFIDRLSWIVEGVGGEIVMIHRVENPDLWRRYHLTRELIAQKRHLAKPIDVKTMADWMNKEFELDRGIREVMLLHGTSARAAPLVYREGFDCRVSSLDGKYGSGIYFTDDIEKSDKYCDDDREGLRHVIFSRVVVGSPCLTNRYLRNQRRPPKSGDRLLDSVIADVDKYREYIVYDNCQGYPELVISYRREKKCFCC